MDKSSTLKKNVLVVQKQVKIFLRTLHDQEDVTKYTAGKTESRRLRDFSFFTGGKNRNGEK